MSNFSYRPLIAPDSNSMHRVGRGVDTLFISGWMPKKLFDIIGEEYSDHFAAMWSLYSPTPGVDYLVRNLLANPQIKNLVLFSITPQDEAVPSCRAVVKFRDCGTIKVLRGGREYHKVEGVEAPVYIGGDIPDAHIEALRGRLSCFTVTEVDSLPHVLGTIRSDRQGGRTGEPLFFPVPQVEIPKGGAAPPTHVIRGGDIKETWVKALGYVYRQGNGTPREVVNLISVIEGEGGEEGYSDIYPVSREQLNTYVEQFLKGVKTSSVASDYTYHDRIKDQTTGVLKLLYADSNTRRAVVDLWRDGDQQSVNPPCLTQILFRVVKGRLCVTAVFRSHDIYGAWVSNVHALMGLQKRYCHALNLIQGELTVISHAAHIYTQNIGATQTVLRGHREDVKFDPLGNFIISVELTGVVVKLYNVNGELMQTWAGRNPLKIGGEIREAYPHIYPEHLYYLGVEIGRACQSADGKFTYIQDRP